MFFCKATTMRHISILALAAVLCCVQSLEYADLEILGMNCPQFLSCNIIERSNSNFTGRNCECDRACVLFSDCCVDARTRVASRSRRNVPFTCMPFGTEANTGAYVINTCPRNFAGPAEILGKCQNRNNYSDPIMAAPVTDVTSRLTYQNRFCAECNEASVDALQTWVLHMDCDFLSEVNNSYIWEHISYRPNLNKWGVVVNRVFRSCDLLFERPDYLRNSVRLCRANVISGCPRNYARTQIKRECESYTGVVYASLDRVYKNPHCALCNNMTVDQIACAPGVTSRTKKPFSFALLLDVNQSDGDVVGVSRPRGEVCEANQKYDPYFKKCRNLVCALPGYRIVNGKCQKP